MTLSPYYTISIANYYNERMIVIVWPRNISPISARISYVVINNLEGNDEKQLPFRQQLLIPIRQTIKTWTCFEGRRKRKEVGE
jgi:hypothetical protein